MNLNIFLLIDGSLMLIGLPLLMILKGKKKKSYINHLTEKVTPITAVISFLIVLEILRGMPSTGLEPMTSPLPRECSTAELQGLVERWAGLDLNQRRRSQRIYSPPPLTTRAPTRST